MRRLVALLVLLAALPAAAPAQNGGSAAEELMPGVTYERQVRLTPHGPVVITVITAPAPGSNGGLYTLGPVLAGGTLTGPRKRVTQLQRELAREALTVGISGDSTSALGIPNGIVVDDGLYQHSPAAGRSSIGFGADGGMRVTRFAFTGTWRGSGQRRPLHAVNHRPRTNQTVLFTPAWGAATPAVANAAAVVLRPFPGPKPNTDLEAQVASGSSGATPIPADGAVLVSTGTEAAKLAAEAPEGQTVTTRLVLPTAWTDTVAAIGGGPLLVRGGRAVFRTTENFDADDLARRDARAAVGQRADGRLLFVAVDGGRPGYSIGMTSYELALSMVRLGATTAAAVEPGRAVTAAFDGKLLNRPSDPTGERAVKEALLLQYVGVHAPPPTAELVGRHNLSSRQQLAYALVRPSTVSAVLVGPDGTEQELDAGSREPGIYRFAAPPLEGEGVWRWRVTATDDEDRRSVAERTFSVDFTLSGVRAAGTPRAPSFRFALARPASVGLEIETPGGTVVARVRATRFEAGTRSLAWDGTLATGARAPAGRYVARVVATSEVGTMALPTPFRLPG